MTDDYNYSQTLARMMVGRGGECINDDKDVDGLTLGVVGEGSYDIDDIDEDVDCFDNVDCVGDEAV